MPRYFAPISVDDLKAKLEVVLDDKGMYELLEKLDKDIKVNFNLENVATSPSDFGPKTLLGYQSEPNGLTYCGFAAGGDWESPVFFLVYWDGKKLRGYVPSEGNPWNRTTKEAYGNDDEADVKDLKKLGFATEEDESDFDVGDLEFDEEAIRQDILSRILPAKV